MSPAPQHVTESSSISSRPTRGASAWVDVSSSFADSDASTPCSTRRASFPRPCSRLTSVVVSAVPASTASGTIRPVRIASALVAVHELRERMLALNLSEESSWLLLAGELVQRPRLVHVRRDMRREREAALLCAMELIANFICFTLETMPCVFGTSSVSRSQPVSRRADEPLRVLRAHVAVDAFLDRLAPSFAIASRGSTPLGQRSVQKKQRVHSQMPCCSLYSSSRSTVDASRGSPTKRMPLRAPAGPEIPGRIHRVALRDTAAAVDAERLLVHGVHALLRDAVLLAVLGHVVARLEVRLHRLELLPERLHVDDEVLDDRQVAHRRDIGNSPACAMSYMLTLHASTAAPFMRMPQEPQIIIRQLFLRVVRRLVLDPVEAVEQRRLCPGVETRTPSAPAAAGGVVPQILKATCTLGLPSPTNRLVGRVERLDSGGSTRSTSLSKS